MQRGHVVAIFVALASSSPAFADRGPVLTLGAMFGGHEGQPPVDSLDGQVMQPSLGPMALLSIEERALAVAETGDYTFDPSIVPELVVATLFDAEMAETVLGAGLRLELRIADDSTRIGVFLVGRALLVGEDRDRAGAGGVGAHVYVSERVRLFGDMSVSVRERAAAGTSETSEIGVYVTTGLGWDLSR